MSDENTQESGQNTDQTTVDTASTATDSVAKESTIGSAIDTSAQAGVAPTDPLLDATTVTDAALTVAASLGDPVVGGTGVSVIDVPVSAKAEVIITPTIGRMVWFRPDSATIYAKGINMVDQDAETAQPLSAQIVYVHDAHTVNLACYDQYGYPFAVARVTLLTGNEEVKPEGSYAEWMGYQLGQAKAAA